MACGISHLLHWQTASLPLSHQGSPQIKLQKDPFVLIMYWPSLFINSVHWSLKNYGIFLTDLKETLTFTPKSNTMTLFTSFPSILSKKKPRKPQTAKASGGFGTHPQCRNLSRYDEITVIFKNYSVSCFTFYIKWEKRTLLAEICKRKQPGSLSITLWIIETQMINTSAFSQATRRPQGERNDCFLRASKDLNIGKKILSEK